MGSYKARRAGHAAIATIAVLVVMALTGSAVAAKCTPIKKQDWKDLMQFSSPTVIPSLAVNYFLLVNDCD